MPNKLNTEEFIERAIKKHNSLYSYENSFYIDINTLLKINCKIHGEFLQKPVKHLSGHGCLKCGEISRRNKRKKSKEYFITKANKVHNGIYKYLDFDYNTIKSKMNIICSNHGLFQQNINNHLQGNGCPICNNYTPTYVYSKNKIGAELLNCDLYLVKIQNINEKFLKIGISKNINGRFKKIERVGYKIKLVYSVPSNLKEVVYFEDFLLKQNYKKYKPLINFSGSTECVTIENLNDVIHDIKKYLININKRSNLVTEILDYEYEK